jgi:hypothetical protein
MIITTIWPHFEFDFRKLKTNVNVIFDCVLILSWTVIEIDIGQKLHFVVSFNIL